MDTHKNASLTPKGREAMVCSVIEGGLSKGCGGAAVQYHAEDRRQVGRAFPRRGRSGLAGPFIEAALIAKPKRPPSVAVETLRRQRHTGEQIAAEVGVSAATVSRILKRLASIAYRRSSRPSPYAATNGQPLARSSTSTSKSWASSAGSAIGLRVTGPAKATPAASAGSMCIWRSTTIPVSPTRKSCRTKSAALACVSCSTPCASFEASASRSSARHLWRGAPFFTRAVDNFARQRERTGAVNVMPTVPTCDCHALVHVDGSEIFDE
jgi:hypothetical protein